ncbi:VCBS repeat-containing protein [Streptomyces sp. WAC08241]|uniref:FG-GAP repeat domain-containing protein n=1 Tax=Streptomyces sp. WAC08241 TaxID=2487421 RepID=UPI000F7AE05B|nr:VCBS repeat-containing protein [Streptomyces sp. WAC08241]RSS37661.1 VCBS repeat-containing protein [Streptomyces sp. WAC08241]
MKQSSPSRRTAAAIAVVLSVALGGTAPAMSAAAAPATGPGPGAVAPAPGGVITLPRTIGLVSVGPSGFLTLEPGERGDVHRWTNTVDGTSRVLPEPAWYSGGSSDLLVTSGDGATATYRVYDMSSPDGAYRTVPRRTDRSLWGTVGQMLITTEWDAAARVHRTPHLVTPDGGAGSDRPVTGLPADLKVLKVAPASASTVLVHYTAPGADSVVRHHIAVVDTATAAVVERRQVGDGTEYFAPVALSGSRLAWVEHPEGSSRPTARLMYAERGGEGPASVVEDAGLVGNGNVVGAVGDWIAYASGRGYDATAPSPGHALTAFHTVDGARITLLDHVFDVQPAPDGTLLVRGGSLERGEGIYRIALGEDGRPAATLVARTAGSTALTLVGADAPARQVLKGNHDQIKLSWSLSRYHADVTVTLRHTRTGKSYTSTSPYATHGEDGTRYVQLWWDGLTNAREVAPEGDYTWQLDAEPLNGIGPALKASGSFALTRWAYPHDYDDDATPDLLAMDYSGFLYTETTSSRDPREKIGEGFRIYDRIESAGNLAGGTAGDFVARDKTGVLWSFLGRGDGTFVPRTRIGGGWNTYDKIAAGSDLTGDGRPDLVAVDTAGALWLHKATGDWKTPYAPRVKLAAGGFDTYNQITAVGDLAGNPTGDLIARDKSGVLWSFLGKGDGTFAPRTRIGGGWNVYTQLAGAGDVNDDGRADLVAYGSGGTYLYPGTGSWQVPFGKPTPTGLLVNETGSFIDVT